MDGSNESQDDRLRVLNFIIQRQRFLGMFMMTVFRILAEIVGADDLNASQIVSALASNQFGTYLENDYSDTVAYDGLPEHVSLLIRCAIGMEASFRPCVEKNLVAHVIEYGEFDDMANNAIFQSIVQAGRSKGGSLFSMVRDFRMLRYEYVVS